MKAMSRSGNPLCGTVDAGAEASRVLQLMMTAMDHAKRMDGVVRLRSGTMQKFWQIVRATRSVAASSPVRPRKRGSNAGTYCASSAGVSRAGSTVTNSTCTRSASGPSSFIASASADIVVGHASGHCRNPKNTTTALPRKSASVRGFPVWSVSAKSCPNDAPVVSAARNFWPPGRSGGDDRADGDRRGQVRDGAHHCQ
jgi:hypothetical protein